MAERNAAKTKDNSKLKAKIRKLELKNRELEKERDEESNKSRSYSEFLEGIVVQINHKRKCSETTDRNDPPIKKIKHESEYVEDMKDVDLVKDIETFNDKSENLTSVPTADESKDDEGKSKIQEEKEQEAQDSNEKLKIGKRNTELTLEDSDLSKSNIRLLQKEKDELPAFVDSIKNKLTEFSSSLPVPTVEEESSGGTGEDGLIAQLTNLIHQNRNLKRDVSESQQLVQDLEKDKLKDTTEIARLKGELQRNESDSQQLVLNLKKDKLKDTTEIARLKGELRRNVSESQQLVLNMVKDELKDTTEIARLKRELWRNVSDCFEHEER
ncbi:myosin-2 heavy chain isoform X2 [Eurytemora carolleeae]|uniref:myosin-2 heavy chain isoform X2 n=1 Tax=Eurytemora carolleeae TaxID=1294199 RepID=UPI000C763F55|nr:myosin-2 heavy chain isoform X2 [Eurytemora carolleeae]|eukprot:XP_023324037.1 myosin-2 heavy chain-like isoform X2 [Eurytemora affinis]